MGAHTSLVSALVAGLLVCLTGQTSAQDLRAHNRYVSTQQIQTLQKFHDALYSAEHPAYPADPTVRVRLNTVNSLAPRFVPYQAVVEQEYVEGVIDTVCGETDICDSDSWPRQRIRDALLKQEPDCNAAAAELLRQETYLSQIANGFYRGNKDEARSILQSARAYDTNCLNKLEDLDPAAKKSVMSSAALLVLGGSAHCSAVRVSARYFVTARHCYDSTPGHFEYALEEDIALHLLSQAATAIPYRLHDNAYYLSGTTKFAREHDYIWLKVEDGVDLPAFDTTKLAAPRAFHQLVVPGFHKAAYLGEIAHVRDDARDIELNHPAGDDRWLTGIRMDRWCYAALVSEGKCINHSCQSTRIMSGSPIYSWTGTELVLTGLHVARAEQSGTCRSPDKLLVGNLGIVPQLTEIGE